MGGLMLNRNSPTTERERINSILHEYNVKTEDEYQNLVDKTWHKCRCVKCGREISLLTCHFDNGDPICVEH
jgi:hypothetical protein